MKFKELFKTLRVDNIELYNQKSQTGTPFFKGRPNDLHLSTYLDIEEVEVISIDAVYENGDCIMLIVLKGTWGEREW